MCFHERYEYISVEDSSATVQHGGDMFAVDSLQHCITTTLFLYQLGGLLNSNLEPPPNFLRSSFISTLM
jgi:hypothetical protein